MQYLKSLIGTISETHLIGLRGYRNVIQLAKKHDINLVLSDKTVPLTANIKRMCEVIMAAIPNRFIGRIFLRKAPWMQWINLEKLGQPVDEDNVKNKW